MPDDAFTIRSFAAAIRAGRVSARETVDACLARIDAAEETVQAWTFLDPAHARAQADRIDAASRTGAAPGPLHGVPVAVKDVIDTADMPTGDGSELHAERRPQHDATVVSLLREAGAVIVGKTVSTEFALYQPGKTRNPHDPERTPGGSSSGSAAAVAAGMVPLALGTQTAGSTIRPAAYCGVVGYKPSHGLISRHGVLTLSRTLDHVGVFATSIEDAAGLAECLMAYDARDADMRPVARPALVATALAEPPLPPRLAFVRSPAWDEIEPTTADAFAELVDFLDDRVDEVPLPTIFDNAAELHRTILEADVAVGLAPEYERGRKQLSTGLRAMIERGQRIAAGDYIRALARIPLLDAAIDEFYDSFDALLTPAAAGEAPVGLDSTGSPAFCTTWTLLGAPAITLPLLQGPNGMPIGVQLVGKRGDDARLLRTARWLSDLVLKPKRRSRRR